MPKHGAPPPPPRERYLDREGLRRRMAELRAGDVVGEARARREAAGVPYIDPRYLPDVERHKLGDEEAERQIHAIEERRRRFLGLVTAPQEPPPVPLDLWGEEGPPEQEECP